MEHLIDLLRAIDEHGNFRFWTCKNGCNGGVIWKGNVAECLVCGSKNTDNNPLNPTTKDVGG